MTAVLHSAEGITVSLDALPMARLPRFDRPGAWFHVMNRGIGRRVVFPDKRHVRVFTRSSS